MNQDSTNAPMSDLVDRTVVDMDGDKVGTVLDVYLDQDTDQPEWLAVSTGLFGTKVSFVPLAGVGVDGDGNVTIAYPKTLVKESPRAEADGELSEQEERDLYAHYGRDYQPTARAAAIDPGFAPPVSDAEPRRDPTLADSASMVRSEEELRIDKHSQEAGRVKLRKWVETDNVQVTVPVQRQMARVVREPVREGDTAGVGEFVEGEEEIVLSEEVVDVSKRVVAKERIALETETVTEQVDVDETVRKERIEVDGDRIIDGDTRDRR